MTEIVSVCVGQKIKGEFGEGLHFLKLCVVEDRLNIIGFIGFGPNTSSFGDKFILVLTCELNVKENTLTFCDHVSYCVSKTVQKMC